MATPSMLSSRWSRRQAIRTLGVGAVIGLSRQLGEAAQGAAAAGGRLSIASGTVVRTVLKDLPPDALASGMMLFHEHISGNFSTPRATRPERGRGDAAPPIDEERLLEVVVSELKQTWADGVHCIVDATTNRRSPQNIDRVKPLASRSGMNVVVAGGYYRAPYPAALMKLSEEQIADQLF